MASSTNRPPQQVATPIRPSGESGSASGAVKTPAAARITRPGRAKKPLMTLSSNTAPSRAPRPASSRVSSGSPAVGSGEAESTGAGAGVATPEKSEKSPRVRHSDSFVGRAFVCRFARPPAIHSWILATETGPYSLPSAPRMKNIVLPPYRRFRRGQRWRRLLLAGFLADASAHRLDRLFVVNLRALLRGAVDPAHLVGGGPLHAQVGLPAVGRERAVGQRGQDTAAGLDGVRAVAEFAVRRDRGDVTECRIDARAGVPRRDLAHAGGVDHDHAGGRDEEFPLRRGVPALVVRLAHLLRELDAFADEAVDEGGLADAGRAEQRNRAAGQQVGRERLEAAAGLGADDEDRDVGRDGGDFRGERRRVVVDVRFVQDHDGLRPAGPRGGEVALEAVQVVVAVEGADEEHGVG